VTLPWSRQRAETAVGVTATVILRPQLGQNRGGSSGRRHPPQTAAGRPQARQKASMPGSGPGPVGVGPVGDRLTGEAAVGAVAVRGRR
jgi:hypothetical protein